jgi:hypothetical protein
MRSVSDQREGFCPSSRNDDRRAERRRGRSRGGEGTTFRRVSSCSVRPFERFIDCGVNAAGRTPSNEGIDTEATRFRDRDDWGTLITKSSDKSLIVDEESSAARGGSNEESSRTASTLANALRSEVNNTL